MLKLKKIAITGTIGAGKSTVAKIFEENGAYVVEADRIVHELLDTTETPLAKKIVHLFGKKIIEKGKLSRKKIAKIVFNYPEKLKALEKILHPKVLNEIKREYQKARRQKKYHWFVVEIPLLFETRTQKDYDIIITVFADPSLCKKRLKNKMDFEKRMQYQYPIEKKIKYSHFIIDNNGTIDDLKEKVKKIIHTLS